MRIFPIFSKIINWLKLFKLEEEALEGRLEGRLDEQQQEQLSDFNLIISIKLSNLNSFIYLLS